MDRRPDRDARLRLHRRVPHDGAALHPRTPASSPTGAPDAERREAFAERFGSRPLDSIEAVCADPEVDLVVVSLPNQLHLEAVRTAAAHGKARCLHEAARPQCRPRPPRWSASSGTPASSTPISRTSSSTARRSGCARWSRPARSAGSRRSAPARATAARTRPTSGTRSWPAAGRSSTWPPTASKAARFIFGKDARDPRRLRLGRHARPRRPDDRRGQRRDARPVRGRPGRDDGRLVVVQGRSRGSLRGLRRRAAGWSRTSAPPRSGRSSSARPATSARRPTPSTGWVYPVPDETHVHGHDAMMAEVVSAFRDGRPPQ